jgi:hypothetical protein
MALQIKEQGNVVRGTPLVRPNDSLFWFGQPGFVLTLIHYTLFVVIPLLRESNSKKNGRKKCKISLRGGLFNLLFMVKIRLLN